jgi:hypothetical protein
MRMGRYGRVAELVGEAPSQPATPVEEYRSCIAFAQEVEAALIAAGVPVRDMIDVESLIAIGSAEQEFWLPDADAADPRRRSRPDVYLAVCAMYRDEAPYLEEWIEFHRLVGVERFYFYDNESGDDSLAVLAPYIEDGTAVRYERPGSASSQVGLDQVKIPAFHHCLATHGEEARWIAFIDTDEFLFSPTGASVPDMLAEHERWPGVAVNSFVFGAPDRSQDGLVLERCTTRVEEASRLVKCIVDPVRATRCTSAHRFEYTRASAVDENGYPVTRALTKSASLQRLRINHYTARSEEDLRAKAARRFSDRGLGPGELPSPDVLQRMYRSGVRDETIMRYLPSLRGAVSL